jgi:hypothetical protein
MVKIHGSRPKDIKTCSNTILRSCFSSKPRKPQFFYPSKIPTTWYMILYNAMYKEVRVWITGGSNLPLAPSTIAKLCNAK